MATVVLPPLKATLKLVIMMEVAPILSIQIAPVSRVSPGGLGAFETPPCRPQAKVWGRIRWRVDRGPYFLRYELCKS